MNIRKLMTWLAGATALVLAACGGGGSSGGIGGTGGGGIGGTGVAYGAITAFGSVWVNGVEYSTSNTTFKTDDNPNGGGSQNDLRIGMVVQVDGSISGATASTITVDESIKGFVEQVLDANRMVVMGQTVQIDNLTKFDNNVVPVQGDRVNVYGLVAGDGIVAASFVEKKTTAPNPPFAVKGLVKNHNTTAQTFQVGSLTVQYSGTTVVSDMPAGTWNGLQVDVKGTACSAVAPVCGTLTASQVEPAGAKLSSASQGEIEGIVSAVTASGFTIGNQVVATTGSTRYEGGVFGDIAVGTKLEAEGSISGGVLTATKVSFRDAVRLEGDIASISGGTLTLSGLPGVTVNVTSITELKNVASIGALAVGNHLRIRGKLGSNGAVGASQVEMRSTSPDTRVELQAPASAVTPETSVTLLGITVTTGNVSSYKNLSDTQISKAEFFTAAKVGTLIKARGTLSAGTVTWSELQLEN
jgi:hypothetical protein